MKDTDVIIKQLYPFVANVLDERSKDFLKNMAEFLNERHEQVHAIAPYENIYYNRKDVDKLYKSLGFSEEDVLPMLKNIFYWDKNYNPGCAKEPYILILLCCIRYYLKNNERKNAELTAIYLCFTGKIYASLYGKLWKFTAKDSKQVMDFVVNNMLTEKFDLKKEGSIFGAIKKLVISWLDNYGDELKGSPSDDDCGKLIQQIRDRVNSFLKNIAKLFYQAYNNKSYLNYETDSLDEDDFHLTDNDAATAARITEAAMNVLISQRVDLAICEDCVNDNVKDFNEIKSIIESILSEKENIPQVRRVVNIIICDYLENNKKGRVGSADFVKYSLQAKPNTKSKILIEMKSTITHWLDENSANYRRRKSRPATANDYYKVVLSYFIFTICKVSG